MAAVARALELDPGRLERLPAVSGAAAAGGACLKLGDKASGRAWRLAAAPPPPQPAEPALCLADDSPPPGSDGDWFLIRFRTAQDSCIPPEALIGLSPDRQREAALLHAETVAAEAEAIAREIFAGQGIAVAQSGPDEFFGPFGVVQAPPGIVDTIARDPRVVFIGSYRRPQVLDQSSWPGVADSLAMTRTDEVQALGIDGSGVRVAILESGGLFYDRGCYNLEAEQDEQDAAAHISSAMAIVGSSLAAASSRCEGDRVGYAPGATLLMANGRAKIGDENPRVISDWVSAASWAVENEADVISMSFHDDVEETEGGLCARDVFFDYLAACLRISVFTSAGNDGCLRRPVRFASGKGYNMVGVGNVVNSIGLERCGERMVPQSSWLNPETPHRDRELPEIAAPGSRYALAGGSFGGTSAATPAAAGIAALLIQARPELRRQPEAVRALLLATADYQLADLWDWAPGPECDGRDGTGLLNARRAYGAATGEAAGSGYDFGEMTAGSFAGGVAGVALAAGERRLLPRRTLDREWAIELEAASQARAVFTWNSDVESDRGPSVLDVDLDLEVVGPDGAQVALAATCDNNYELVSFSPPEDGTYVLRVFGYEIPPELDSFFGVAWTTFEGGCARLSALCGSDGPTCP